MDKRYWVGFNLVFGIAAVRFQALQNHFGDLSVARQAPLAVLQAASLSPKLAERVLQIRASLNLEKFMSKLGAQGIQILTWVNEIYPGRLKEIDQPSSVLYMRGEMKPENFWSVSVVGTRSVGAHGRQISNALAVFLANNGVTDVSGPTHGADAIAHPDALKAWGADSCSAWRRPDLSARIYPYGRENDDKGSHIERFTIRTRFGNAGHAGTQRVGKAGWRDELRRGS